MMHGKALAFLGVCLRSWRRLCTQKTGWPAEKAELEQALRVAQIVSPRTPPAFASRPRRSSGAADGNAAASNGARSGTGTGTGKGTGINRSARQGSILAGFGGADAEA